MIPFIRNKNLHALLFGLLGLLWVISVSALINNAGALNIFLDILLLSEPFLMLLLMTASPMSRQDIYRFQLVLLLLLAVHLIICYFQYYTRAHLGPDEVDGLFLGQGNGPHVAGAVGVVSAVYYYARFPFPSFILRLITVLSLFLLVVATESRYVLGTVLLAVGALVLLKLKSFKQFMQYATLLVIGAGGIFLSAMLIFPQMFRLLTEMHGLEEGLTIKFGVFPLLLSYFDTFLNWLFGLGPGHTAGRLGKILPEYYELFSPWGATISPVTQAVYDLQESSWVSQSVHGKIKGSSLWSPFFSWAGIFGDLGLLGIGLYLGLWFLIFQRFCPDDLSRFFLFNTLILAGIYGWLEEPGYMLLVAALIGLNWQEYQLQTSNYPALERGTSTSPLQSGNQEQYFNKRF